MRLIRRYSFEASHQLGFLPPDHPCSRLHGHGYRFEVTVTAENLDHRAMIVEYGELDEVMAKVLDRYDHRHMNDFLDQPTVEVIVRDIYSMLPTGKYSQAWWVKSVRLWETERSSIEYP
jgi:6-pyruvoyltetrahydropterin/6-carboxytetrahydropterin synthase